MAAPKVSARDFTDQRIYDILDDSEHREILRPYSPITPLSSPWPATCSFSFLISVLVPHVSARASVVPPDASLFALPSCGVDPWVTDYITPLANTPSRPMQSDNLYRMFLAWQQACPQRLLRYFLGHLRRSSHPVSQWIYSGLS